MLAAILQVSCRDGAVRKHISFGREAALSTTSTNGGTIVTVGPGQEYSTIAAAVSAAQSGDTIDVQAGIYTNDFIDTAKGLTLQAVGGVVQMVETQSPPNGKAMITEGGSGVSFTINGFDISGVSVASSLGGNGAAVRYQGGNLTLNNDYFHNNQDGILGNPPTAGQGTVTINNSEFAFNGSGTGFTHNIYIGDVANLIIENSYIHDASVGHEIKSRAENTTITNSRIFDNNSTASYSIDLPNGGNATITSDVIQQGPDSQNPIIVSYGEEGGLHTGTNVQISGDTIVNNEAGSVLGVKNVTNSPITVSNDQVYGLTNSDLTSGSANVSGITYLSSQPTLDTSSNWQPPGSTPTPTPAPTPTPTPMPKVLGFTAMDMTTGQSAPSNVQPYSGPVTGLQEEYINITSDNLDVSVSTDSWFIHTGGGEDAIAVHGGTNVLDGGTGSNFLTGGGGTDTFFVDDRAATADTWSTIVGFHAGDAATIWGVTPQDFSLSWLDNQGAAGYTGLTLHATAAGKPTASITLAGYSSSDLNNGRLSVQFGTVSGNAYMYVHANS